MLNPSKVSEIKGSLLWNDNVRAVAEVVNGNAEVLREVIKELKNIKNLITESEEEE